MSHTPSNKVHFPDCSVIHLCISQGMHDYVLLHPHSFPKERKISNLTQISNGLLRHDPRILVPSILASLKPAVYSTFRLCLSGVLALIMPYLLYFNRPLPYLNTQPERQETIMFHLRPPRSRPSLHGFLSSFFISFLAFVPIAQAAAVNVLRTRAEARSLSWEQLEDVFRQGTVEEGE